MNDQVVDEDSSVVCIGDLERFFGNRYELVVVILGVLLFDWEEGIVFFGYDFSLLFQSFI